MTRAYDLLVVGGGPAGTTLATLVKKYAPHRRVVLLEREPGPRHHIGESLLPGLVPVLREMGAFEKIDRAGFPRKIGANYVWGKDRTPWENDFNEINVSEMIERYGGLPAGIEYAWQVRRSVYDEILLRHARSCGVEVRRGPAAAAEGIIEEDGRIAGVTLRGGRRLRAEFTADCSGQIGFLSRFRRVREYNKALRNVAGYSYYRGARWKYTFTGHPDKTKIFVCSLPQGWLWYIPIEKDLVSVGLVTQVSYLRRRGTTDLRALHREAVRDCAEIRPLLAKARRERDFDGTGKDFFTQNDWSYLNVAAAGPGWLAAGDAAVFVDPILSSGVTLAHLCGHRAAYTLLTWWAERQPAVRGLLWPDYDRFCREVAAQYLAMALFWYGNDPCAERWWGRARRLQRAWLPVKLTDKCAFVTVAAGVTQHYERIFAATGIDDERGPTPEELPFCKAVLGGGPRDPGPGGDDGVPRLKCRRRVEYTFLPARGGGRLKPVKRLRFLLHDHDDPVQDAFNPRRIVTRYHLELLELINGRRTLRQALEEGARRGIARWWLDRNARGFLSDLRTQGVLAP